MLDLVGFVQLVLDIDAVIADRGIGIGARGRQIGQLPAQAITQRADLAGAARKRAQVIDAGLDVLDAFVDVEALHQAEGLLPFGVGLVGELDAGLHPPEQVGHQGEKAARGQAVGDVAHHLVDAENFLDDDDARAAPGPGLAR